MRTISQMVDQEVMCCMSSMVHALASGCGDVSPRRAPALAELAEQAVMLTCGVSDFEEAAIEAGWTQTLDGDWWRVPTETELDVRGSDYLRMFLGSGPFMFQDTAQEACDWDNVSPCEREIYEHWAVSGWFGRKLEEQGERVDFDFAGLTVWARTTTGQAIYADAVVEKIYSIVTKA